VKGQGLEPGGATLCKTCAPSHDSEVRGVAPRERGRVDRPGRGRPRVRQDSAITTQRSRA